MPRTRRAATASAVRDVLSSHDILSHIFSHLPLPDYVTAAATCTTFHDVAREAWLLAKLDLGMHEPSGWAESRQAFLRRLCDAGNAHACYRLAMAYAYHPQEAHRSLEDSLQLLERALALGDDERL